MRALPPADFLPVRHQVTIYVPPDDDPWQAATQYARASFASAAEIAVFSGRAFQRQSPDLPQLQDPTQVGLWLSGMM